MYDIVNWSEPSKRWLLTLVVIFIMYSLGWLKPLINFPWKVSDIYFNIFVVTGLKRSEVGPLIVLGIIAIRYIISPLLGIVIVKAAKHFGMVGSDSLYQFTLMLQYALPPAMTVGMCDHRIFIGDYYMQLFKPKTTSFDPIKYRRRE